MMAGLVIPAATATSTATAATTTQVAGTDVSNLTTVTSWPDVKAAGMTFVGVEAAQGKTITNSLYDSQVTGATSAGLYVMPYVYADPGKVDGATQFTDGWNVINGIPGDPYVVGGRMLPIVLDMESDPVNFPNEPCYGLSQSQMTSWIQAFAAADLKQTGASPTIYTDPSWWSSCIGTTNPFGAYPLWIAEYGVSSPSIPSGWSSYTFWQSSDTGSVNGISGAADLDQMQGAQGSIKVTAANQSSTAGTPVWLRVATSGLDQAVGFAPSLTMTGLPAGLSMSAGGVISGWPYKPGTSKVTVSASDGLGGTGSATFMWTVKAAPASGATGTIKQWGGSGKCLDDSGSKTSNGAAVDLWSCTGKAGQSWTMAPDGTVRVLGKCLDAVGEGKANGTRLQLWACNSGDGAQQWLAGTNSQLVNPQSGKCLYVPSANAANGTRPELSTCVTTNVANYHWLRPAASVYSGNAGKCLAVSGTTAVLASCANTSAQHWTQSWNGTLQNGSSCLTATSTGVSVGSCSGATRWQLTGVGTLPLGTEIAASGQCVTAPSASNGVALKMEACAATDGATWHAE
jgi:GH25 family lysozyme M1 (1,4-beta-N-acetylmuramidase)